MAVQPQPTPAVHVLDTDALAQEDWEELQRWSSPERLQRAARFKLAADRLRCIGAGLLLDYVLAHDLGLPPGRSIATGHHGKPYVVGHPDSHVNVSHAGNLVICTASRWPVGLDVELINDRAVSAALSRFSSDETEYILTSPASELGLRFTTVWSRKESYLKYRGCGLNYPLNTFSVLSTQGMMSLIDTAPPLTLTSVITDDGMSVIARCGHDGPGFALHPVAPHHLLNPAPCQDCSTGPRITFTGSSQMRVEVGQPGCRPRSLDD